MKEDGYMKRNLFHDLVDIRIAELNLIKTKRR